MGSLLRHCWVVSFALFLLYATTPTPTYGDEEEEDGGDGGGDDGQGKKAEKVIDEWETEEPHYDEPEWMMPDGVQTLEFGGQDLNDADKWSPHMPLELKCDGCRAIAHAIKQKLKGYQKRYRIRHILSEADVVELLDQVCNNKNKEFDGYGLKEILGRRRLSGPGLETKDTPGVSHGGGQWPYRLQQMCKEYVEEVGEYRIYKRFLQHRSLENFLCRNRKSELGWICPKKRKRRKKPEGEGEGEGEGEATPSETPTGENEQPQDSDQPAKESESSAEDSGPPRQAREDAQQQPSEGSKSSEEGAGKPQAGDAGESVQPPREAKTPEEGAPKPKDGVKSPAEEAAKPPEPSQDAEKPKEDLQNSPKEEGIKSTHREAEADQKTRKEDASEDSKNQQDGKGKDEKGKGDQSKPSEKQQQSSAEDAKAKSEPPKGDKKTSKEEL